MAEQIGFIIVALAILGAGSRVVTAQNLVHTVLWLALTLLSTAVAFIMLEASFLAAIQVILYTGGVLTLMLFGVMLTHRDEGFVTVRNPHHRVLSGLVLGGAVFAMLAGAIVRTPLPANPAPAATTKSLGVAFLTEHVLAFEVLSLLLLAAVLGAIVLARKRDAGDEQEISGPPIAARRKLGPGSSQQVEPGRALQPVATEGSER